MILRKNNIFRSSLLLILITLLGLVLRIYKITLVPPALHGDELGVGYNAYSLLKTGRDEYGQYLPLVFRNDFTPLVFYLTIPFIGILGLNEFATRLPTALFSVMTLPVIYLFILKLFNKHRLALLTSFFVAISSWDIRIARIGVGITLPLFFQLSATYLFLKSFNIYKSLKIKYLIFSFILFSLSLYSYQSSKITTPLLVFSLLFIYKSKFQIKRYLILFLLLYILFIILPTVQYLLSLPLEKMRFTGISVFTLWRNTLVNKTSILSYLSPLNLFQLFQMIFINYFKHFDPKILFFDNSNLRYHQLPSIGLFYPWQIIFIVIGFFSFLKLIIKEEVKFIFYWLLISPSASALTSGVPYANVSRALMMLPIIELFCAVGIISIFNLLKKLSNPNFNYLYYLLLTILFSTNLIFFNRQYFIKTAKDNSIFWGAHLKEMVMYILPLEKSADKIIISNSLSPQTYMYILFYGKKEPQWLFDNKGNLADIVGYSSFGKYEFRSINWKEDKNIPNTLLVGTSQEIPENESKTLNLITSPNSVKLLIYKTKY